MGQVIAAIVVRSVLTAAALAQQPHSPPFEVVSIKPNSALDRSGMISSPAGSQLRVSNSALRMIINYAYKPRTCSRRFRNNSG